MCFDVGKQSEGTPGDKGQAQVCTEGKHYLQLLNSASDSVCLTPFLSFKIKDSAEFFNTSYYYQ